MRADCRGLLGSFDCSVGTGSWGQKGHDPDPILSRMTRGRPRKAPWRQEVGESAACRPRGSDGKAGWCLCKTCFVAYSGLPGHVIPLVPQRQARDHCKTAGTQHERFWCDPRIEHLTMLPQAVQPLLDPQPMEVEAGGFGSAEGGCLPLHCQSKSAGRSFEHFKLLLAV